jgi:hypothetical protein
MSSADIDEIYDKLLEIFQVRYPYNPRDVLSYKISELVGEGRTRENAILTLYEREGKITLTEARELGETIRKEKEETIEKQIKEHKKSLETLTLLFSKGELTEESYEAAIKPLEDKIARLEREKKEDEIKVLEEKLAKLKSVNREEATPKPKRELVELPAPPPTAPTKRLGFKTISKYFMHGFAFSLIMLALFFVWVFVLVFLTVAGSFIGLVLGFVVLLFILSGVNSFLTESIWSISTQQEWVSLLFHGFTLFVALIAAHIPAIIISLIVPSIATTIVMFIANAFIDGFVAKNVASWWEEEY